MPFTGQIVVATHDVSHVVGQGEEGVVLPAPAELCAVGESWFCLFEWGWLPIDNGNLTFTDQQSGAFTSEEAIRFLSERKKFSHQ